MKKDEDNKITQIKWSLPMSIEELSQIYNVHRNTMSKWLRESVICNRQLSPRRWQVAMHEIPDKVDKKEIQEAK